MELDFAQAIEYALIAIFVFGVQYLMYKYQDKGSSNFMTFVIQSLLVIQELEETDLSNGERYVLAIAKIQESLRNIGITLDDDEIGETVNNIVKLLRKAQEVKN